MLSVTPLTKRALHLNHQIQRHIFHYIQPFHWDKSKERFVPFTSWVLLIPWVIINFILIPWAQVISGSGILISYVLTWYTDFNILQLFLVCTYVLFGFPVIATTSNFLYKSKEWIIFLNTIVHLGKPNSVEKYSRNEEHENFDKFGAGLIGMELFIFFVSITVPVFLISLDLDTPYLLYKLIIPPHWYSILWKRTLLQIIRVIAFSLSAAEYYTIGRTFIVYLYVLLGCYKNHLNTLGNLEVTCEAVIKYRELCILFSVISEPLSFTVSAWLGAAYWGGLICNTLAILGFSKMDWRFYVGIPMAGVIVFVNLIIAWDLATLVDERSKWVKGGWESFLGHCKMSLFERRIWRKVVTSLRPISIKYGTMGTMKRSTRRAYLYSLVSDTLEMIIAMKKPFDMLV